MIYAFIVLAIRMLHSQTELEVKIREIRQLRERMKAAAETTRAKEELYKQLVSLHLVFT